MNNLLSRLRFLETRKTLAEQRAGRHKGNANAPTAGGGPWDRLTDAERNAIMTMPLDALKAGALDAAQAAAWARFEALCGELEAEPAPLLAGLTDEEIGHLVDNLRAELLYQESCAVVPEEVSDEGTGGDTSA